MSYRRHSRQQYGVKRTPKLSLVVSRGRMLRGATPNWVEQWEVQSHRDPSKFYVVTLEENGDFKCSCPQWIYRRRECKHIQEVKDSIRAQTFTPKLRTEDFFINESGEKQLRLPV